MGGMEKLVILIVDDDFPSGQLERIQRNVNNCLMDLGAHDIAVVDVLEPPSPAFNDCYADWALQELEVQIERHRHCLVAAFVDLCLNSSDWSRHEGITILQYLKEKLPDCKRILFSGKVKRSLIGGVEVADSFISLSERGPVLEEQIRDAVDSALCKWKHPAR